MIKNECGHAYKLLDHAECLWCENCVEKLIKRLSKESEVTDEFVRHWADVLHNADTGLFGIKGELKLVRQMLREAGVEISVV